VIKAWSPTNYSPAGMAQLFYNAGARFVLVQGVHHDNFDNWNSRYNPWNMMNFGAKRDTMAEWTNALHNLGMHMGVAFHHEYSWWFTQPDFLSDSTGTFAGVPYDAVTATNSAGTWWQNYDVRRLYNQDIHKYQGISTPTTSYWNPGSGIFTNDLDYCHWYATQWALRMLDVVETYNPDFIYTDGDSSQPFSGYATGTGYKCDAMQRVIAHFYNRTLERHGKLDTLAVVKFHGGDHIGTTFEGGYSSTIKEDQPWFAEFGIGDWFWRPGISYDNGGAIVYRLLEAISRDGAMMVNIPNRPDGALDSGATNMLQGVGQWMAIHSEGIYGSRAWVQPTEGSFRFTVGTNGCLYAFYEGIPSGGTKLTIASLATTSSYLVAPITSVSLLGSAATLSWSQTATGLVVTLSATMPSLPAGTAIGLKIGPATAIGSATPANVIALPGTNQINLSWYCPSATATFNVKRSLTHGGTYTPIATNVTAMVFNDTNALPDTLYFYVVTAVDAAGESVKSSEASASLAGAPSSNWLTEDVGAVGATGSFSLSGSVFTIQGSGADIWNSSDEFRYVFQLLTGDCSITARVLNMQNTAGWAKAGVMIRETLDTSSQYVINYMSPENGTALQERSGTGGSASGVTGNTGVAAPYWVQLVRTNDTFTSFISPDGTNWTQSGTTTVAMDTCVYAGVAVCSVNDGTLCQAQFDNVSFLFTNQSVVVTPAALVHRYSFNETSGTTAYDSVGGANGTLNGGATFDGSGEVVLNGTSGTYVSLPVNLLTGFSKVTIDAWFSFMVPNNNVHLFSMDDGGGYGSGGSYLRYNVFDNTPGNGHGGTNYFEGIIGYGGNVLHGGSLLPTNNTQVHVTLVYDPVNGVKSIYVNGVLSSTYNGSLAALSSYPQNAFTLGRSPWANDGDPYLKGSINEFRIYNTVLSAGEIAANDAAGPDTIPQIMVGAPQLSPINTVYAGETVMLSCGVSGPTNGYYWQWDNGSGGASFIPIAGATALNCIQATTGLLGSYQYQFVATNSSSSVTSSMVTLTVNAATMPFITSGITTGSAAQYVGGSVTFAAAFDGNHPITYQWQVDKGGGFVGIAGATNTSLTLTNLQLSDSGNYRLAAMNSIGGNVSTAATLTVSSIPLPPLIHRYSFNETSGTVAHDYIGGADGTLNGSAAFDGNGRVVLNGTSGTYVALPGNLIAGLTNVTIEAWVTNAVSPDNVALFSFDDGLQDGVGGGYLRFVLHDQSNGRNFLELASGGGSPKITANPGLGGQYVHVVCVYNPSAGVALIYTNGVLEVSQAVSTSLTNVSLNAAALGRSPWGGDPWLAGAIDEFRIYAGQLLPADITAAQTVGPNVLLTTNVSLAVSQGYGSLTLSWPVAGSGFTLVSSSALGAGAVWIPFNITPSIIGTNTQVSIIPTNATMFFRLQR
jgi:alpha-L-fucosidase